MIYVNDNRETIYSHPLAIVPRRRRKKKKIKKTLKYKFRKCLPIFLREVNIDCVSDTDLVHSEKCVVYFWIRRHINYPSLARVKFLACIVVIRSRMCVCGCC